MHFGGLGDIRRELRMNVEAAESYVTETRMSLVKLNGDAHHRHYSL